MTSVTVDGSPQAAATITRSTVSPSSEGESPATCEYDAYTYSRLMRPYGRLSEAVAVELAKVPVVGALTVTMSKVSGGNTAIVTSVPTGTFVAAIVMGTGLTVAVGSVRSAVV